MLRYLASVWLVPFLALVTAVVPSRASGASGASGAPRNKLTDAVHGPLYHLGDFDECVFERDGKYCLAQVHILEGNATSVLWLDIKAMNSLKTRYRRDLLYNAVCVERNASERTAQDITSDIFTPLAVDAGVQVRIQAPTCTTSDKPPWGAADIVMGVVVILLLILALSATSYEYFQIITEQGLSSSSSNTASRCLSCFSLLRSWRSLADLRHDNRSLRCIQGIRAVTMMMFINGHHLLLTLGGPISHEERLEKTYTFLPQMLMVNGHILLSVIFVISGFMASYNFLKDVRKNDGFKMSLLRNSCVNRYLRLTPAYAFVVLLTVSFLSRISTGPIWHATVDSARDNCRRLWWINMLYLNNYIFPEDPCLLHTWYLAADLQLYCVCTGLLVVAIVYPRTAKVVLGGGLLLGIVIPFVQTYLMEDLNPTLLVLPETMRHLTKDPTYIYSYITAHNNLGPYMVGLIAGYIYTHIVRNEVKLTKMAVALLWLISLTVPLICWLGAYWYYQPGYQYGRLEAAFFSSLNRVVYSAAIATAMMGCSLGHGWLMNRILSWTGFVIFARLGYCVYLVHFLLQTVQLGITRQPVDLDTFFLLSRSVSHIVVSFLYALLLHLFVELPFTALRKVLMPDRQKNKTELKEMHKTRRDYVHQKTDDNTFNNVSFVANDELCQNPSIEACVINSIEKQF